MLVHLDIGGEGRHPGALNVNPAQVTSTTGAPGRTIPNLVRARAEALPFADAVAHLVTVESAPIRAGAPQELARVVRPGGTITLLHPSDYAAAAHDSVAGALGLQLADRSTTTLPGGMTQTVLRRAAALLR